MSRLVEVPIDSITLVKGAPSSFTYRRQRVVVAEVLDRFVVRGRWWEGEPETYWWRIRSSADGVCEPYQERTPERKWFLYKIHD